MATKRWQPKALAVAQVATVEVTAYDAATTYTLAVNGLDLVAVAGNTDIPGTAALLDATWEPLTHIYASGVNSAVNGNTVVLSAATAELPFTISPSVDGGNGTIGNFTITTNPTGPHTVTDADNWGGTAPANDDTIVFENSDVAALWDLDGLSSGNVALEVRGTAVGSIGLDAQAFETAAAGGSGNTTAPEYRPRYLALDCRRIEIGEHTGPGTPANSGRVLINNTRSGASQTIIHGTRPQGDDSNEPPVRLLYAHANADIEVRGGAVGVAVDAAEETSTIGDVTVIDGSFYCGPGTTMTNFTQRSGASALNLGTATLTSATLHGGSLHIDGNQTVTTISTWGGECMVSTTGNVTTCNARGGRTTFSATEATTLTTLNLHKGAVFEYDPDVLTITNIVLADDGMQAITISDARG